MMWLADHWSSINPFLMGSSLLGIAVCSGVLLLRREMPASRVALSVHHDWENSIDAFIEGRSHGSASPLLTRMESEYQRYQSIERGRE